jgi:glycerol-3-phosphate dehydrogenase (NAD(P)+)
MQADAEPVDIGVIGAGAWGTALADLLAGKGHRVDLWAFEEEVRDAIRNDRENRLFLPGVTLAANLTPCCELAPVISGKALLLVVVPSHVMRETTLRMSAHVPPETIVVSASKGIENVTHLTMTGVLAETLPQVPQGRLAALSGPSFAREVAGRVPTVVTVACRDLQVAAAIQRIFATPYFRVYTNSDVIGVELGGAVKNVIAIAAGIIDGLGLGLNTRAALITRGLTEIRRLGLALGANPRTFPGLAGVGDLILTCTGTLSRNHTVGQKIGQGMKLADILGDMRTVAEGVKTARSVYNLSRKVGVEMPICNEIYHVLYDGVPPAVALERLMTRDLRHELDEH